MTKRSNILAKISLRDGHVSPWGESRLAISANKQKQTDSRFVLLQSFQTAAKYTRNNLIYSELPPHDLRRIRQFTVQGCSHQEQPFGILYLSPWDGVALSQRCGTSIFRTNTNHQSLNNLI